MLVVGTMVSVVVVAVENTVVMIWSVSKGSMETSERKYKLKQAINLYHNDRVRRKSFK